MEIFIVAGARPNFMKISPIIRAINTKKDADKGSNLEWKLVHTGQHYDYEMSQAFFEDLEINASAIISDEYLPILPGF